MVDYILICGFRHLLNDTTVWLMHLNFTCVQGLCVWIADLPTSATVTFFFNNTTITQQLYTAVILSMLNTYQSVRDFLFFFFFLWAIILDLCHNRKLAFTVGGDRLFCLLSWLSHLCMAPWLCFHIWERSVHMPSLRFHMQRCNSWLHPSAHSLCTGWEKREKGGEKRNVTVILRALLKEGTLRSVFRH